MKQPKYLRDMDTPTVFGYVLDRATLTPVTRYTDTSWTLPSVTGG
jgi:hypothetical protein